MSNLEHPFAVVPTAVATTFGAELNATGKATDVGPPIAPVPIEKAYTSVPDWTFGIEMGTPLISGVLVKFFVPAMVWFVASLTYLASLISYDVIWVADTKLTGLYIEVSRIGLGYSDICFDFIENRLK